MSNRRWSSTIIPFVAAFAFLIGVPAASAQQSICACFFESGEERNCESVIGTIPNLTQCTQFCEEREEDAQLPLDDTSFASDKDSDAGQAIQNACAASGQSVAPPAEAPVGATEPPPRPFITPRLSVDIPGVSFTDAISLQGGLLNVNFIGRYVTGVYQYLLGVSTIFAIIMIMIGGVQYVLSRGDAGSIGKAKDRMKNAVVGLVLLLSVYTILFTVNPGLTVFEPQQIPIVRGVVFVSTENTDEDVAALGLPDPPASGTNGVPYFSQRDYGNVSYGGCGTIKSSGCGPTAAAMVYRHLGVNVDPRVVAETYANEGSRACPTEDGELQCSQCNGTYYSAFRESSITVNNGLQGTLIDKEDQTKILELLGQDKPLVVSVGPSKFTRGGHFIVLTGLDEDGNILVNDPNSGIQSATQDEIFTALRSVTLIERKPR